MDCYEEIPYGTKLGCTIDLSMRALQLHAQLTSWSFRMLEIEILILQLAIVSRIALVDKAVIGWSSPASKLWPTALPNPGGRSNIVLTSVICKYLEQYILTFRILMPSCKRKLSGRSDYEGAKRLSMT